MEIIDRDKLPHGRGKTIGEVYGSAMDTTDEAEAKKYFDGIVKHIQDNWDVPKEQAEEQVRTNLAYYSGCFSRDVQERVSRLFGEVSK